MPTTRKRQVVTETEQVARALDDATRRWPEEAGNRSRLLPAGAGLKLPDCGVLLAAEQVVGSLATFDDRLAGVARERGVDVQVG